jgi:hypothetical protein
MRKVARPAPAILHPMAEALTTRSDWLAAHPPARERLTETLAAVAGRVRAGEDFRHAVREFLDEFALRGDDRARFEASRPSGPTATDSILPRAFSSNRYSAPSRRPRRSGLFLAGLHVPEEHCKLLGFLTLR